MAETTAATAAPEADDVDLQLWGDNVRYWRTERGLTQMQLAGRVQWQQSRVSEVEQGRRRPSDVQRIALARVLGVPVRTLFPFPKDVG